jgi:hypothetical protein
MESLSVIDRAHSINKERYGKEVILFIISVKTFLEVLMDRLKLIYVNVL